MGKLLNEQEIIENNIKKLIERTSSEYTRFLESTPTFVTYYQRDYISSTNDIGLENIEKDLGRDSPVMYNKIENLPIYGIDNISLSLSREEIGLNTSYEGEGILIPNTIKPYQEDFFFIEYIGEYYLFKVNNVNNDAIKSKPFYKIDFYFFKIIDSIDKIEEQIKNEYTVIFNNIGTEDKPIIEKSIFMTLDYMNKIITNLQDYFIKCFYDPKMNIISLDINGKKIYNRHLNKLLIDYNLLKPKREFMNTIYLVDFLKEDINFLESYKSTIYKALELQSISLLGGEYIRLIPIYDIHTPFSQYSLQFNSVYFVETNDENTISIFPENFFNRIKIDQKYTDENHIIENIIIDFLNDELVINKSLLDKINEINFLPDIYSYSFIPLLLYIFKASENKILETF